MIAAIKKRTYACWIDPDNQVRSKAPKVEKIQTLMQTYLKGYVQVCYVDGAKMRLSGTLSALKNSRDRWVALASSINTIELDLIDTSDSAPLFGNALTFDYPAELSDLDKLIDG